jgi:transcription antitermination protein NusB
MTDSVLRRARFLVLEALYETDATGSGHEAEGAYAARLAEAAEEDPEVAGPGPSGFGRGILRGVLRRQPELDEYIASAATELPFDAIPLVDRNILRLALWELLSDTSAPVGAVVNEAVELAHRYGGDRSPAFVNAVLRTLSGRIRAASVSPGTPPDTPSSDLEE